jgi:tyrosyl-tRNA synthetase
MASDADRLARGTVDVIPRGGLVRKLGLGRPLRVKLGVDPSRPDLTLGHGVVLQKLREFQEAGHVAVLIIGDFTARIGDPSGASQTRPMLSEAEVAANARTYLEQAGIVIDVGAAEIRRNAEWLGSMDMEALIRLASIATVAQMLEREDFRERYRGGQPISVVELLYPLLQGYDSVAVDADVELGGTDQTFNLLMGREVQRAHGQEPQVVVTLPLLEGLDGRRKMSKSFDNYVALTDPADEMFGKLMSIPDRLIARYRFLTLGFDPAERDRVVAGLSDGSLHPNDEKRRLAREVVDRYHGRGAGEAAERAFDRVHRDHLVPEEIPDRLVPRDVFERRSDGVWIMHTPGLLEALGLVGSRSEARRLLAQGGVRVDGDPERREEVVLDRTPPGDFAGSIWQVGRRRFARLAGVSR